MTDTKTAAYSAKIGELVLCNPTGGGFTVTLPTAVSNNGLFVVVKNNSASTNTITVDGEGSETIDGSANATITTARGRMWVVSNGAGWVIVG